MRSVFGKSQLADEVFQDIVDGIRSNVSVGYEITKMEKAKGKQDEENPKYRVNWKPLEASIVSVPADATVGVGRSRGRLSTDDESNKQTIKVITRENTMEKANETPKVETSKVNVEEQIAKARKDETARIKEITSLGAKHNCSDLASKAINEKVSVAKRKASLLSEVPCGDKFLHCKLLKDATAAEGRLPDLEERLYEITSSKSQKQDTQLIKR